MKKIVFFAFLLLSIHAESENFKLFKPTSLKVFALLPEMDSTLNLKFDSVGFNGEDSVYHVYKDISNQWVDGTDCNFWGNDQCRLQNKPKWMGSTVYFNTNHEYKFITWANGLLHMKFPSVEGDSSYFYEDATRRFSITYESKDTLTVLGLLDSVQQYRIKHFDHAGNTIESPLNNYMIMVGKTLGLIQFFHVDKFPNGLIPLRLIGNNAPNAGLYSITQGMVYDFQPGDEIQYNYYSLFHWQGQTIYNYNYFTKYTILERTDSANIANYKAIYERFNADFTNYVYDTIQLAYNKNLVIIGLPFDEINQNDALMGRSLRKLSYCGLSLMRFKSSINIGTGYCESRNCWGNIDAFGPPPTETETYVFGLGLYDNFYRKFDYAHQNYTEYRQYIVYFKKNGVVCGSEIIVGTAEHSALEPLFSIFPNPAKNSLTLEAEKNSVGTVTIFNLTGQEVHSEKMIGQRSTLDLSELKAGIYLLQLVSGDKVEVKKIIKE